MFIHQPANMIETSWFLEVPYVELSFTYLLIYEREEYHKFDEQLQKQKNVSVKETKFMVDRNMNKIGRNAWKNQVFE